MIILAIFFSILIFLYFISLKLEVSFILSGLDYYFRIDGYIFFHLFNEERGSKIKKLDRGKDVRINPLTRIFNRYAQNIKHPRNKKRMPKHAAVFQKISIEIAVGLIEIMPTIYTIPVLGAIISMLIRYNSDDIKNFKFKISPVYNKLCFDLKIHSIVKLKLAHIIYIILMIYMEGAKRNGRPSNTRAHEYSYE